jgi:hypothetical protein
MQQFPESFRTLLKCNGSPRYLPGHNPGYALGGGQHGQGTRNGDRITSAPGMDVQVDVAFRQYGVTPGVNVRETVALRGMVTDLDSLRMADMGRLDSWPPSP